MQKKYLDKTAKSLKITDVEVMFVVRKSDEKPKKTLIKLKDWIRTLPTEDITDAKFFCLAILQNAQLGALQSQINPHFLFNTLDTINWITIETIGGNMTLSQLVKGRVDINVSAY